MQSIDPSLVRRVEKGDHGAFEELYRHYFPRCFSVAMYYLRVRETAEDVVSEVFLMLWDRRGSLAGIRDLDSYIYIAVRNASVAWIRKNRKGGGPASQPLTIEIRCGDLSPEDELLRGEFDRVLGAAMASLPERARLVYHLVREEKMSYRQVGRALDISERTVNSHMTTAVKILVGKVGEYLKKK